jgi:hypothetical protein
LIMLLALGAASSVIDALQSLTSQKSSSAGQPATDPFDVSAGATTSAGATSPQPASGFSPISPQTMSALITAQGDATNTAPTNPSDALQDLFSQIDANGDGAITETEFENALGAGGTNTTAADKVFGELDTNGDGTVSLDEMKSALLGAGGHHGDGHHMHAHGAGGGGDGSDPGSDPLLQALSGASSTSVTNSDGSTTTSITYADGSKVSLTTPAASTSSTSIATSSYNLIEQLIQREAQALSASVASSLPVSV